MDHWPLIHSAFTQGSRTAENSGIMDRDIIVSSWSDLQNRLFENSWDDRLHRYRSPFAFRGLADSCYELSSSLIRLGGNYSELEQSLLRNFKKYVTANILRSNSAWEVLAVAQHHGLSTRLLDWTYSPYVALHFATAAVQKYHLNGVIWCVNFSKLNRLLPEKLKRKVEEEQSDVLTIDMLQDVCQSLRAFDEIDPTPFVVFLEPPSLDERIVNQFALFSLISSPRVVLGDWLKSRPELYHRIIIPASLKAEIRDKLDQSNINERMLFPGPDGLCLWLKRYYSPLASGA